MRPEIKNTPIPHWMKHLKRDRRGYPIPYIVLIDKEGKPHFTINEESRRQEVIKKQLCGICGRKLVRWRALVGGPVSAFLEDGAYIDPPMHIECAHYALQVCPFIAVPSYVKPIDDKTLDMDKLESDMCILIDNTTIPGKPFTGLFVMVVHAKADYIHFGQTSQVVQYIKPKKPYIRAEFWQHGKQLDDETGQGLVKQALEEHLAKQLPDANRQYEEVLVQSILQQP